MKASPLDETDEEDLSEVNTEISSATYRTLDASFNRSREGLRVVEDYVRFHLNDSYLTGQCKQLRHQIVNAFRFVPYEERIAARETQQDVGTGLSTDQEENRQGTNALLGSNFGRLTEALRTMEEFGKLLHPQFGQEIQSIRYNSYTIEKAIMSRVQGMSALEE